MARVPRSQSHATVTRTQPLSLNRGRCSTLSSLGSIDTPAAHITQARVHSLSCTSADSGTNAIAVTRVSTARHHSGTGVVAVTRVSL